MPKDCGATEAQIQKAIIQYLGMLENRGDLIYQRMNSGSIFVTDPIVGKKRCVSLARRGTADIYVGTKSGCTLWLEVKRPGKKLTQWQQVFRDKVLRIGHIYEIVTSLSDVRRLFDELERDHDRK